MQKVNGENVYYPIGYLARHVFVEEYLACQRRFEKLGQVVQDPASQALCVSASFLRRYEEFREYEAGRLEKKILAQYGGNRDIQKLQPSADLISRRSLLAHLPLANEKLLTKQHLERALAFGKWRNAVAGGVPFFVLYDFLEIDSWASPAELSWKRAVDNLQGLVVGQLKNKEDWTENLTNIAVKNPVINKIGIEVIRPVVQNEVAEASDAAIVEEAKALGAKPLAENSEGPQAPKEPDVKKRKHVGRPFKEGRQVATSALKIAADAIEASTNAKEARGYDGKWKQFSWDVWQTKMPDVRKRSYLGQLPPELLMKALEEADAWAKLLEEERTGVARATGAIQPAAFTKAFAEKQQEIYADRAAWVNGDLVPVLPPDFVFLF